MSASLPGSGASAAGTSASLGRERNAARSVNPGMSRQAITEPQFYTNICSCVKMAGTDRSETWRSAASASSAATHLPTRRWARSSATCSVSPPIAVDGVGAELFAAAERRCPRGRSSLRGGRRRRAHRSGCSSAISTSAIARAPRGGRRDRRSQRERPLALHPLPRAGREALRARRGARSGSVTHGSNSRRPAQAAATTDHVLDGDGVERSSSQRSASSPETAAPAPAPAGDPAAALERPVRRCVLERITPVAACARCGRGSGSHSASRRRQAVDEPSRLPALPLEDLRAARDRAPRPAGDRATAFGEQGHGEQRRQVRVLHHSPTAPSPLAKPAAASRRTGSPSAAECARPISGSVTIVTSTRRHRPSAGRPRSRAAARTRRSFSSLVVGRRATMSTSRSLSGGSPRASPNRGDRRRRSRARARRGGSRRRDRVAPGLPPQPGHALRAASHGSTRSSRAAARRRHGRAPRTARRPSAAPARAPPRRGRRSSSGSGRAPAASPGRPRGRD